MIEGVDKGFTKKLEIQGIGYKAEVKGNEIVFGLGFSHPVNIMIPSGLKVVHEKGILTIEGIDKEAVGAFAAKIRDLKKPEPYKGKGIRYQGEYVAMKQGKKTV
jgi:large subunit ribosomal protein L6